MSGNCWTRIFLMLYVLGLSLGAVQRSYKFAIKEANSILTDHVVAEEISISLLKCAIMCTDNPDCLSLNYHKLERKCEINSATADQFPADLVPRENVNHLSEMGGKTTTTASTTTQPTATIAATMQATTTATKTTAATTTKPTTTAAATTTQPTTTAATTTQPTTTIATTTQATTTATTTSVPTTTQPTTTQPTTTVATTTPATTTQPTTVPATTTQATTTATTTTQSITTPATTTPATTTQPTTVPGRTTQATTTAATTTQPTTTVTTTTQPTTTPATTTQPTTTPATTTQPTTVPATTTQATTTATTTTKPTTTTQPTTVPATTTAVVYPADVVMQSRSSGSLDFSLRWQNYVDGFSDETELWIGLEYIHKMTTTVKCGLLIEITDAAGFSLYATFLSFQLGGAETSYQISIGDYDGTAGEDPSPQLTGLPFSTEDKDLSSTGSLMSTMRGGWWVNTTAYTNLNGVYQPSGVSPGEGQGLYWSYTDSGHKASYTISKMTIKQLSTYPTHDDLAPASASTPAGDSDAAALAPTSASKPAGDSDAAAALAPTSASKPAGDSDAAALEPASPIR